MLQIRIGAEASAEGTVVLQAAVTLSGEVTSGETS